MSLQLLPAGLVHTLPNPDTPWYVSRQVFNRLQFRPGQQDPYTACDIKEGDPEYKFVHASFNHQVPENRMIGRIRCIHNPGLTRAFEAKIHSMEAQARDPYFVSRWPQDDTPSVKELRKATLAFWEREVEPFSPFYIVTRKDKIVTRKDKYEHVKVLPLWHGSSAVKCDSIARLRFARFGKHDFAQGGADDKSTDIGIFGDGIYFTTSPKYAAEVYGEGHLLLSWVVMRKPFPIVSDEIVVPPLEPKDIQVLKGRRAYGAYDTHYSHVLPVRDANGKLYHYPCAQGQEPLYNEYVVDDSAQALPKFWIELVVAIIRNPRPQVEETFWKKRALVILGASVAGACMAIPLILKATSSESSEPVMASGTGQDSAEEDLSQAYTNLTVVINRLSGQALPLSSLNSTFCNMADVLQRIAQDLAPYIVASCAESLQSVFSSWMPKELTVQHLQGVTQDLLQWEGGSMCNLTALKTFPSIPFGAALWEEYFGLKVDQLPLPLDIDKILASECPFFPGKKVIETHFLTLVPEDMTLRKLVPLMKKAKQGNKIGFSYKDSPAQALYSDSSSGRAHWVLMTKDVIPASRNRNWQDQQALASNYKPQGYELLSLAEAATAIFIEYVQTGRIFYPQEPLTYTRCVEQLFNKWPMIIGAFGPGEVLVTFSGDGASESYGLGLARKFH